MRKATRAVAFLLLVLFTTSCGHGGMPAPYDEDLPKKLAEVQQTGNSALLRDLAGGDWDQVHIYSEGIPRHHVESEVGSTLDIDEYLYGDWHLLVVFVKDGKAQRALMLQPPNLPDGVYSDGVRVERIEPNSSLLRLVEP